jgi:hypothetical protein
MSERRLGARARTSRVLVITLPGTWCKTLSATRDDMLATDKGPGHSSAGQTCTQGLSALIGRHGCGCHCARADGSAGRSARRRCRERHSQDELGGVGSVASRVKFRFRNEGPMRLR